MRRRGAQDADDARLGVDPDMHGVRDQLRLEERLHAQPAETAAVGRCSSGCSGTGPEPLPRIAVPVPASSAIETAFCGEPLTVTTPSRELEIERVDLELLGGELEQLVADLPRRLASPRGRC